MIMPALQFGAGLIFSELPVFSKHLNDCGRLMYE